MILRFIKKLIKFWIISKRFSKSKIYLDASIDKSSTLGINSVVFSNTILINTKLDDYSYVQKNSEIINANIGKFCSIASNVNIGLANHPTYMVSTNPVFYDNTQPLPFFFTQKKEFDETIPLTIIGSDVWVGQNAIIKAGVNIGTGAIIGAGAVVTKDVEPYSVVAGVPAKHIKYRFDKVTREKLIVSKWWTFDEEKLEKLTPYFKEPKLFLEKLDEI